MRPRCAIAPSSLEYTPESFDRWYNLGVAQQKTGNLGRGRQGLFGSRSHPPDASQAT